MALILDCRGFSPKFGNNNYFAPNATIVGDVEMGDDCSIWFNAVVRGDVNSIRIGNKVNIQDNATLHCTYEKTKLIIGNNVLIAPLSYVNIDVPDNSLVIGNPAKIIPKEDATDGYINFTIV